MLRLIGFFALVYVLTLVLGHLPVVGAFFRSTGIFGLWFTAVLLSLVASRLGALAYRRRRDRATVRQLAAVESPHNQGKLGALLLAQGRARRALPHLERAVQGEPGVAEWHYRLGTAQLLLRRPAEAAAALERAVALDEEHAYGAALMRLAEARSASGAHDGALADLARLEKNHGPSPESAYRRGLALKQLGRREEARSALREVSELARHAARYQRRTAGLWVVRARLALLV